jgi:hypothetical protein
LINRQSILSTKRSIFLCTIIFCNVYCVKAQSQLNVGILPSANVNLKLQRGWELNIKYESRHFIYQESQNPEDQFGYDYALSDFTFLAGKKVGINNKVIGGLMLRTEEGSVAYRSIQQFIFSTSGRFRIVHRISTDQTFSSEEDTEFRLRYRISSEFPLNGEKLDAHEFYFKVNNEYLNGIQGNRYDLEIRIIPLLGYMINNKHKIEIGLDNRIDSFLNQETQVTSWIALNWFLSLKND